MTEMSILNLVLWSVQAFLALFFLAAGAPKLIGRGIERWTGFSDLPRPQVVFIGSWLRPSACWSLRRSSMSSSS